jgi:glycosyltransferase involved in cell wall biosynthesis
VIVASRVSASRLDRDKPFNIAMLAPPWIPTPPPGYGGIEHVVASLCDGMVKLGHHVTLFAAPGSRSLATVHEVLPRSYPNAIGQALHESDHVSRVLDVLDEAAEKGEPFDILHDHCGFTTVAVADRIATPVIHTLHGPFTSDTGAFYRQHGDNVLLVAISEAQRASAPSGVQVAGVVPNPIDVDDWPFRPEKEDYAFWAGRFNEFKGAHRAIAAAHKADIPLILAGPVQPGQEEYFQREIEPHLDDKQVRYLGEVGGNEKKELFANARALLMPITWDEPFGMVMVEALACGTPVIAFARGAATEIIQDQVNGYLVNDVESMAAAIAALDHLDPAICRESVAKRFTPEIVSKGYVDIYRQALTPPPPRWSLSEPSQKRRLEISRGGWRSGVTRRPQSTPR